MMLSLYKALTAAAGPLIRFYLSRRLARGKEDPKRFTERLGEASRARPQGPVVWIHGASVGESLSMMPLIERICEAHGNWNVLVTTGTVTSARLMGERLPDNVLHQFVPVDHPAYVDRFLDHWKPNLVVWAESEFWPNLIDGIASRTIPMVLVNGRISERSYKRWQRFPGLISGLLAGFRLCLGQTEKDAARLAALGAGETKCVGNLKFAAPPLPADSLLLDELSRTFSNRPLWLAASTHPGEEKVVGDTHKHLKFKHPGLLTVIAPRHPGRGPNIVGTLTAAGLNVALRSLRQPVTGNTDIYIADTLGELGLFYRLAAIVFMGKSLFGDGGQNPLEAARLNCAIISGPNTTNFTEIMDKLKRANACLEIADEAGLAATVDRLLGDGAERMRLTQAAFEVAEAEIGVLDAVMAELQPYLNEGNRHADT